MATLLAPTPCRQTQQPQRWWPGQRCSWQQRKVGFGGLFKVLGHWDLCIVLQNSVIEPQYNSYSSTITDKLGCRVTADGAGEVTSAAEFLHGRRTYQGLVEADPMGEAAPVVPIKQGRTGRAAQYREEGTL